MKEGWGDLREMKKLSKKWRKREAELDIELLLVEDNGVVGLLLSRHKVIVYQAYGNVIQNTKALPKLLFKKEFSRFFR